MTRLMYCRQATAQRLADEIDASLDWYYQPRAQDTLPPLLGEGAVVDSGLEVEPFWESLLLPGESDSPRKRAATDRSNAITVRRALSELPPVQAADGRLWTWLCHTTCSEYVKRRWMHTRPRDDTDAKQSVSTHFFCRPESDSDTRQCDLTVVVDWRNGAQNRTGRRRTFPRGRSANPRDSAASVGATLPGYESSHLEWSLPTDARKLRNRRSPSTVAATRAVPSLDARLEWSWRACAVGCSC